MEFTVQSLPRAVKIFDQHAAIISLVCEGYQPECAGDHHHICVMDDVCDPEWPNAPTQEHVRDIIRFLEQYADILKSDDKSLLVHCHAGISRSTAVAAIALVHIGGFNPLGALREVHRRRPQSWPNDLIIRHYDDIQNMGGTFKGALARWKGENMKNDWWKENYE